MYLRENFDILEKFPATLIMAKDPYKRLRDKRAKENKQQSPIGT